MRFLIDENLPPEIAQMIVHGKHEAFEIAGSGLHGSSDDSLWELAANDNMILVSRDTDFPLPTSPAPRGVILLRPGWADNRVAILSMFRQFVASGGLEMGSGTIAVLSPGREPRAEPAYA
jgi:predicted nuclease of predicted toxin-antitoxin system